MIPRKIKEILSDLSFSELQEAKKFINTQLKEKGEKDSQRVGGDRFKTNILGSCIIEREREFFNQEHKITILDLSPQGIKFKCSAEIIKGEFLQIFFRSPWKGTIKEIYAKVVRVKLLKTRNKTFVEVGAKSEDYKEIIKYRRALAKGHASKG